MFRNTGLDGIKLVMLFGVTIFMLNAEVLAQQDVISESQKIQDAYKNAGNLSFEMRYTYAFEGEPAVLQDSSIGNFKISGRRYWGTIDSTEFIQDDSFALVVYHPGKLIYVSKPSNLYPQLTGFSSLDSLVGKEGYRYSFNRTGENTTLNLLFTDTISPYKRFSLTYSAITYRLMQMEFVIREEYLSGEASPGIVADTPAKYMLVKAVYNNYTDNYINSAVFNSNNYFENKDGVAMPVAKFSNYQVFLSSPDLSSTQKSIRK